MQTNLYVKAPYWVFFFFFFETESYYINQARFKLTMNSWLSFNLLSCSLPSDGITDVKHHTQPLNVLYNTKYQFINPCHNRFISFALPNYFCCSPLKLLSFPRSANCYTLCQEEWNNYTLLFRVKLLPTPLMAFLHCDKNNAEMNLSLVHWIFYVSPALEYSIWLL
jgi:hypothetical protein